MSQSDRLFLEELCPTVQQKIMQKLVEEPESDLPEQDFQDFEVGYSLSSEGSLIQLKILYPFLAEVLKQGSQELLETVWVGLPVQSKVDAEVGLLQVWVDAGPLTGKEAESRRCADLLAAARTWLLIGPLVQRLRWLRGAIADAAEAASKAQPGGAAEAARRAIGQPPPKLALQVRRLETCWIVSKEDRILVIMSVHLEDEVDVALGRAFCQEFAETNRKPTDFSLPCNFYEPKDLPPDLREGAPLSSTPNVGFLTLTLADQTVRGASEERLYALARPVMTFRNFFHFHLKHAKSYLHSRLRKRIDGWHQQLNRARRPPRRAQEKRRLVSGKEFVPPSRITAPS